MQAVGMIEQVSRQMGGWLLRFLQLFQAGAAQMIEGGMAGGDDRLNAQQKDCD
jgi:hypothetical protein